MAEFWKQKGILITMLSRSALQRALSFRHITYKNTRNSSLTMRIDDLSAYNFVHVYEKVTRNLVQGLLNIYSRMFVIVHHIRFLISLLIQGASFCYVRCVDRN